MDWHFQLFPLQETSRFDLNVLVIAEGCNFPLPELIHSAILNVASMRAVAWVA